LQTELHRHLDVCTRPATLLRLAQERGLEAQSTSLEAFRQKTQIRTPMTDLSTVLAQFELFARVLDRPEVLEQVAFEAVEDCHREGTRAVELRFSPTFVTEFSKLDWAVALDSFERGVKRALAQYPDMRAGMICIASRDYGVGEVARTVEFYLKNLNRFVGLDLAGNEVQYPCSLFAEAFKGVRAAGGRVTIHAGEATGPDNMWEAIELLGASRIGHGIACVRDPRLMEHLRDNAICLEMCPTSNWLTQSVKKLEEHPLPVVLRAGVPVCINTDDPGIFPVTLPSEIEICRTRMGMSEAEIAQCMGHAARASFLQNPGK
jgi:adenosine deaminase